MSKSQTAKTQTLDTAAHLSDGDLDQVAGGLLPAVAPAPLVAPSAPVLPAVQRGLIGLL